MMPTKHNPFQWRFWCSRCDSLACILAPLHIRSRSKSSSQRILTIGLAKRIIVAIVLLVPVSCIPNYLSFDLVTDTTTLPNMTIYKVSSSAAILYRVFYCLFLSMPGSFLYSIC